VVDQQPPNQTADKDGQASVEDQIRCVPGHLLQRQNIVGEVESGDVESGPGQTAYSLDQTDPPEGTAGHPEEGQDRDEQGGKNEYFFIAVTVAQLPPQREGDELYEHNQRGGNHELNIAEAQVFQHIGDEERPGKKHCKIQGEVVQHEPAVVGAKHLNRKVEESLPISGQFRVGDIVFQGQEDRGSDTSQHSQAEDQKKTQVRAYLK